MRDSACERKSQHYSGHYSDFSGLVGTNHVVCLRDAQGYMGRRWEKGKARLLGLFLVMAQI